MIKTYSGVYNDYTTQRITKDLQEETLPKIFLAHKDTYLSYAKGKYETINLADSYTPQFNLFEIPNIKELLLSSFSLNKEDKEYYTHNLNKAFSLIKNENYKENLEILIKSIKKSHLKTFLKTHLNSYKFTDTTLSFNEFIHQEKTLFFNLTFNTETNLFYTTLILNALKEMPPRAVILEHNLLNTFLEIKTLKNLKKHTLYLSISSLKLVSKEIKELLNEETVIDTFMDYKNECVQRVKDGEILFLLDLHETLKTNISFFKESVAFNVNVFKYAPLKFKTDAAIAKEFLKINGECYMGLKENLQELKSIAILALENSSNPTLLSQIHPKIYGDKEINEIAIKNNPNAFEYAHHLIKSDEDIIFKLLIIDKKYYDYVNEDIKKIGNANDFILYYKKKIAELDTFFEKFFDIK